MIVGRSWRPSRRDVLRHGTAATAVAVLPAPSIAQAWPSKPIKIICGYPAGGLTDIFARAYGEYISQKTGQPVTVENKAGASGAIAAEQVKSAPPDGHTLMWTISTTMIMNKVLFKKLPYDPDKDFVPISWMDAGHLPTIVNKNVTMGSEPNSIYANGGTALMIHAAADDMKTDPAGNAGARIACGVITK